MTISSNKYRSEIDGLRAIAVLVVVIFHLDPTYLPGGFVGVDIFFVISGYLITNIIHIQMLAGQFTFKEFYERRIKRILPIFYFVVFFSLSVGYFILSPSELLSLSNSAIAANSFLANFRFMLTGNYFQEENMRPLLHLWSLAVEEQFYFLWPSLLLLLIKMKKSWIPAILVFLIILSFVGAEVASRDLRWATMSYYMLPTRAGELLLGAILVFMSTPNKKLVAEISSFLGIALIIYSIMLVDSQSVFPGLFSFIPCSGCALVIAAGPNTFVAKCLSFAPLAFFGLISYSLYLWHWPFIVFYKSYFIVDTISPIVAIFIFILIVFVSWITTVLIENRFRKSKLSFSATFIYYLLSPMVILFVVSFSIRSQNGMPERFGLNDKMGVTQTVDCNYDQNGSCFITSTGSSSILLLGDSHANHFSNLLKILGDRLQIRIIRAVSEGCAFEQQKFSNQDCETLKSKIERLASKVDKIIIVKRIENIFQNEQVFNEYIDFIKRLTKYKKPIVVFAQVPRNNNLRFLDVYIKSRSSKNPDLINRTTDPLVFAANKALSSELLLLQNVSLINFNKSFCDKSNCRLFDDDGFPIYFDDDHLSAYGAEWLAEDIYAKREFTEFIRWLEESE